ncbi:MAG: TetR/AcrR family transcriptional regulator [Ignavibacteria bacterium]|nr:TetR/AcrR family transcriptional regulator [Ignavibacteria bacterium]
MIDIKENIILYAREVFFSNGFHKTSMESISSGLQISKKTLYKYFPSKEVLLEVIVCKELEEGKNKLNSIINSKGNVVEKIISIYEYYMQEISKYSNLWFRDLRMHTPKLWQKVHDFEICNIYSRLKNLIEQGKKENLINKELPSDLIIHASNAITHSLLVPTMAVSKEYSLKELVEFIFNFQLSGILNEKGRMLYNKILKLRYSKKINKRKKSQSRNKIKKNV